MVRTIHVYIFVAVAGLMSFSASAQTPGEILAAIKDEAKNSDQAFKGFSADRGASFFKQKHANELSCAACHTENPAVSGKHSKTGKIIQALAPAANAERFTDSAKVNKWFRRNCNDVLERVCSPQEKGDVLTYLLTVKN
jgi:uncharacterized membrane protein